MARKKKYHYTKLQPKILTLEQFNFEMSRAGSANHQPALSADLGHPPAEAICLVQAFRLLVNGFHKQRFQKPDV